MPTARVAWGRTHRLVMSHFPPIDLYDDIADPRDWELITAAVQRTNPRLAATYGDPSLVPVERRVSGEGASWVMAAFVHVSPDRRSRFSDGSFGVYYAGDTLETALREHTFHMARFYASTGEDPGWISEVRELVGAIDADLVDLRGPDGAAYLDPDPARYAAPQELAKSRRAAGADGVVYPSVRNPGGQCIGVFWPDVVSLPRQADHYRYHWDGEKVDYVRRISGDRAIFDLSLR
ncbi:RES family NAD+ phosphorylase [Rhodovulum tesquicola]|uniref:RES family NAD+ phosphorylase n=1 Tax=Rhodovulum tesquicola TaxID=540254 RepID=UPI001405288D|nr:MULTISPECIES: RES family NAD+ phosphorylase [Rhodovulum]MCO8145880.1 RES family NAD+ phosphorylase [Rhodovulum tesquicola]